MEKIFNRYYFGINTKNHIDEIVDQCITCKANKTIPNTSHQFMPMSKPSHPGMIFNADIMVRNRQKILVCRDIFSSYTTATMTPSESANDIKEALIQSISNIRSQLPVTIRTDSASPFKALVNDQQLKSMEIEI